ncbi:PriCT-2 domain-containing protein [Gulbenkiania mobilis]|uniref:PriCT-2 domain-containing protein n=1 Tax=Gulbenkiania mobilis TaxID=397457 RepID=UPI0006BC06CC|nr:PriCT-2 domain-containing protein [Gulbenkiania mobilis]
MNAPFRGFMPDSPERVASALSVLDPSDRELWVKMSFAVKDGLGEAGFDVWDRWSQGAPSYNAHDAKAVWKSARAGGKVTIRSLFGLAREHGWKDDTKPVAVDPAELERRYAEAEELRRQAEAERAAEAADAADKAAKIWNAAKPASDDHPYLARKGVKSFGLRVGKWSVVDQETGEIRTLTDNALLLRLQDNANKIHSLQAILPGKILGGRDKDYLKGGVKSGHFFPIGRPLERDGRLIYILTEGYATAASIHMATGELVLVCFDAGNLATVAQAIRRRKPEATILIAADNDLWNRRPDGTPANPGLEAARKAAIASRCCVAVPPFTDADQDGVDSRGRPTGPTDFNDLHRLQGLEAVKATIEAGLQVGPLAPAKPADVAPVVATVEEAEVSAGTDDDAPEDDESHVERIARDIARGLAKAIGIGVQEAADRFKVDQAVIGRMIEGAFWSGSKSKLFLLNDEQGLNQFSAADAYKFLVRSFGEPVDGYSIACAVEEVIVDRWISKAQAKELRKAASEVPGTVIVDHLKYHNQREGIEWRCDMFANDAKLHLLEDKARVVLAHKPFEERGEYDPAIIADYKEHFTRFDEFLTFLVQSRFALDRKKCYLWILADSDWGKGFLLGVLNSMHLAVGTSMKEIEAMFEGRPVGRAPEEFKRAFALVVDEFKTVKSELKQLQSEITLSPKNQLTASVEVFAKLFLSAESVASLVTENGVEDQFANRMSIFAESGSLVKRPLYIEVGNPRYFESVLAYTVETMNRMVSEMQAMGRVAAQTHAERWINDFIKRNGLDTVYERFSDSLSNVASDAIAWLHEQYRLDRARLLKDGGWFYLPNANKALDLYLIEHFDASEVYAYKRRKPELLRLMSEDGRGAYPYTICGIQKKSVKLKKITAADDEYPV